MAMIIEWQNLNAPELDVFARLTEAQLRNRLEPEKGIFIAESPKVIARALDAGYRPVSLLMERRQIDGPARDILARCPSVPVYTADRELLASLTGYELTRGVLCAMRRPRLPDVEELCAGARRVAVLEGIVDHTNVGAIFRSAAALGMDAVLLTGSCASLYGAKTARAAMGALFRQCVLELSLADTLALLKQNGLKLYGAALSDRAADVRDTDLTKCAVAVGSEGQGLSRELLDACDGEVIIPMQPGSESLNAAVAAAILMWELAK